MEKVREHRDNANKKLKVADHMLVITYPLVKDPKILLTVADNLLTTNVEAMSSVLRRERIYKRVPIYPDTFQAKFDLFKEKLAEKLNINKESLNMIYDLKETLKEHSKSPVEFNRGSKFVICSDSYAIRTLSVEKLKKYISLSKDVLEKTNNFLDEK